VVVQIRIGSARRDGKFALGFVMASISMIPQELWRLDCFAKQIICAVRSSSRAVCPVTELPKSDRGKILRVRQLAHVFAGDDRPHAVLGKCLTRVHTDDLRGRMRRTDDVSVQGADWLWEIVGIATASAEKIRIFLTPDRRSYQRRQVVTLGKGVCKRERWL